jgi:hypothetical protein
MHASTGGRSLRRSLLVVGAFAVGFILSGCGQKEKPAPAPTQEPAGETQNQDGNAVTPQNGGEPEKKPQPAQVAVSGEPTKLVVRWEEKVQYAQDPILPGSALRPGFAGRVQLFPGEGAAAMEADGTLIVELNEVLGDAPGAPPVLRERWEIPVDALKTMVKTDASGVGYALFLPWSTAKPEFKRGQLSATYESAKGTKLKHDSAILTLETSGTPETPTRAE